MRKTRTLIGLLIVAALGLGLLWNRHASEPGAATGAAPSAPLVAAREGEPVRVARERATASVSAAATADAPVADRARRDQMRELIWKAFGQAPPPDTETGKTRYVLPEHGAHWTGFEGLRTDAEPGIEPRYIQDAFRSQFFPLAKKCYVDALGKTPDIRGKIVLWFVIVGDAKVGGIVESVDVLNKSTLRDPEVIECIRESFLGVTFPPPKNGGYVTVEYPIVFSPDDDGGAATRP